MSSIGIQQGNTAAVHGRSGAALWLVSFGDLLTLLLCFFLSLVSFGHVKPLPQVRQKQITTGNSTQNSLADAAAAAFPGRGISIAPLYSGQAAFVVRLESSDFTKAAAGSAPRLQAGLKSILAVNTYKLEAVLIETCSAAAGSREGDGWLISMSRALSLRSQLIDAGINPLAVKLRSVGPHCLSISGGQAGVSGMTAQLTFLRAHEKNG